MQTQPLRPSMAMVLIAITIVFAVMLACVRTIYMDNAAFWSVSGKGLPPAIAAGSATQAAELPLPAGIPGGPVLTPTADAPHPLPAIRTQTEQYVVQPLDMLAEIAGQFGVTPEQIAQANNIADPNYLEVGQVLTIPVPNPEGSGPDFKLIPDSELVYGPASATFDLAGFVQSQGGYLAGYHEEVDGKPGSGAQIVERVAQDYSVNPRLLLAVLQYTSGWVTKPDPREATLEYPIGLRDPSRKGLYRQLAWAANNLNRGFYLWRVNGVATWLLSDGSAIQIAPTINAGTAGVQHFFAMLYDRENWEEAVSENGLLATYSVLFGFPFNLAVEPLLPPDLAQPGMQLPFEPGERWSFTGGPHAAWVDGSAWAALDFAPPGDALGCVDSNAWVVAVADGLIVRTGTGAVIQDLDGDGYEQTGWVVFYMHIEKRQRVDPGTYLKAGERIGHPSCEGGFSTGTHVHIARKYNGEWIPADQNVPFIMDDWISRGDGYEYNGFLVKDGQTVEAFVSRSDSNAIQR